MSSPAQTTINPQKVLDTFLAMVRIDSPSGQEEQMCQYLVERVKPYNLKYEVDNGGNLIVDIPKHGCNHDSVLVLSGHMDVVPPCIGVQPILTEEDGDTIVRSDNTTVLGADDKAGLAPMLEAVFTVLENNLPRPTTRLIFTTREETELGGAKDLADEALNANFALVWDHTGDQGVIINQTPTYVKFTVTCTGKSVHAGIMPEQGINAISYASRVVNRLNLGRLDDDTTANIGFMRGGKATNVVPDLVTVEGEIRSHKMNRIEEELAHIKHVLEDEKEKTPGTDYTLTQHTAFHGYEVDQTDHRVQMLANAFQETGLTPQFIKTNGGSDVNVFAHRGLPGVVLSAAYMDPHALTEQVKLSDMTLCARSIVTLLKWYANDKF